MIPKIVNFFDKHRLILIISLIFLITSIFLLIKLYLFKNHNFKPFSCTNDLNNSTCLYNNILILKEPEKSKKEIFQEYSSFIKALQENYNLPSFNFYTAYYYQLASNLDFQKTNRNETLNTFFNNYVNTYNLKEFYQKNELLYDIYYPYTLI